jgi:hypothetical protein
MVLLIILQVFLGGGIGGFQGQSGGLTFSLDFGKNFKSGFDTGIKFTMSLTGNAPQHIDIPFYNWGNWEDYPRQYFAEYRERNEVGAQFVGRKHFNKFILIGLAGVSMQEYITLPIPDSLQDLPLYPVGERDKYFPIFGGGIGFTIGKLDLCLTYSNRFGLLFDVTRAFRKSN